MTTRKISAAHSGYSGTIGGFTFTNGSVEVDDETAEGKSLIGFAARHGWAVEGVADAIVETVDQGKPLAKWTKSECAKYLTDFHVVFPASAKVEDLRNAIRDMFEVRTEGGAAPNGSAGHISGTAAPIGAPGAIAFDDTEEAAQWAPPLVAPAVADDATSTPEALPEGSETPDGDKPDEVETPDGSDAGSTGGTQDPDKAEGSTPEGVESTEEETPVVPADEAPADQPAESEATTPAPVDVPTDGNTPADSSATGRRAAR